MLPGSIGQMLMVIKIIVNRDNSITLRALGDLRCRVTKAWLPRGMRGIQCAFIESCEAAPQSHTILEVAESRKGMETFGKLCRKVPELAQLLISPGPLTVFVPSNDAFVELERSTGVTVEDLMNRPDLGHLLACHISRGRIKYGNLYNDRDFIALDGSLAQISFSQWPRGTVRLNGAEVTHFDVNCVNGVLHVVEELLVPGYRPGERPNPAPGGVLGNAPSRNQRLRQIEHPSPAGYACC